MTDNGIPEPIKSPMSPRLQHLIGLMISSIEEEENADDYWLCDVCKAKVIIDKSIQD